MAHVLAQQGAGGTIEQRFRNFLLYIAQSGLKDEIRFPENVAPFATFTDPVVILDPVYSRNNVASRITEAERLEIVAAATEALGDGEFRLGRQRQRRLEGNLRTSLQDGG